MITDGNGGGRRQKKSGFCAWLLNPGEQGDQARSAPHHCCFVRDWLLDSTATFSNSDFHPLPIVIRATNKIPYPARLPVGFSLCR